MDSEPLNLSFRTENKNAFRKIVDLHTMVERLEGDGRHAINVHLGIYCDEIELEGAVVEVGLKTAFVSVEAEGLEIDQGSKYGEMAFPAKIGVDHTVMETLSRAIEDSAAVEATIQGSLSPLKAGVEVSAKGQLSGKQTAGYTLSDSRVETRSFQFVEAIGEDRWKLHPEKELLHGKFLHGQTLCETTVAQGRPNRRGVAVSVNVRKRDVEVNLVTDTRVVKFPKTNREKMIALLIAKSLSRASPSSRAESILLSSSESYDEE
ncbi:hypothetical protein DB728_30250 [Rhizobium leguminosarum bv. viciae USDA 2370]|nr:hypothetical protein BS629_20945 [Rhizobium leguminosarum bv. viciae USDA 2370]PUB60972.1 hypothetical protein DB728_30250 [Rhizobium leguminosarum bv. viciae USDA 2370]